MKEQENQEELRRLFADINKEEKEKKEKELEEECRLLTEAIREIDLPYHKREEFFMYLDLGIDCIKLSIEEELFLDFRFEYYVCERLNDYFKKNRYIEESLGMHTTSFYSFGGYVFYDSGDRLRLNSLKPTQSEEIKKITYQHKGSYKDLSAKIVRRMEEMHEENKIENIYTPLYSYIKVEKHDLIFRNFLTDREIFETLFNNAKKEIEQGQNLGYKKILEDKHKFLQEKLERIYPLVIRESGLIVNWYSLLAEYVERIEELIPQEKRIKSLKSKEIMLLIRTLCNSLDIETRDEAFYKLMSDMTGVGYDSTEKYLVDDKLECTNEAFRKNGYTVIKRLEELKVRKQQGNCKEAQDNLTPMIKKLVEELNDAKCDTYKSELMNLNKKYLTKE